MGNSWKGKGDTKMRKGGIISQKNMKEIENKEDGDRKKKRNHLIRDFAPVLQSKRERFLKVPFVHGLT